MKKVVTIVIAIIFLLFTMLSVSLYISLVSHESMLRRLHASLSLLSDFHYKYIKENDCGDWNKYQVELKNMHDKNKNNLGERGIKTYIDFCESCCACPPAVRGPENDVSEDQTGPK